MFLKTAGLIRRRTEARRACLNGIVHLDGAAAKPGREVQAGQRITIRFLDRVLDVEVREVPAGNVSKARAARLYRVLRDERRDVTEF